ncbi:MAG TPA: alpha/beta hydrolase [Candidatus Didemnitutus sp.]|nr:alpha/beta hydrolase [Candidatus Didemnitutus sp.]
MKSRYCFLVGAFFLPLVALAQPAPRVIPLWANGAPGFEKLKDEPEQAKDYWVKHINNPSLTVFLPPKEKANGCAVVVAPGGGFRELVFDAEGKQVADFLNPLGVAVFVLKYRLPNEDGSPYNFENVRADAYRALRTVRTRAGEFGVDPKRIGILGFSAGGGVVMMVAYGKGDGDPKAADPIDRTNGRPDFEMMVYPGGKTPDKIPADAPPAFLVCANDDDYGCDKVTLELLEKFKAAKVSVEAIFFAQGRHAFNMGNRSTFAAVRGWPQRMADWMGDRGFLKPGG